MLVHIYIYNQTTLKIKFQAGANNQNTISKQLKTIQRTTEINLGQIHPVIE